ncbi:ABC transporter ATP-binding protein [Agrobacterium rhizogenes]|nr:ABC transporter ATP-binding protein [Rhizobium rhizogenes]NTH66693.1 ABC transporter ATP-binding protein [Rhizobium rhizogenes]
MSSSGSSASSFAPWDDPKSKPIVEFRSVSKTYGTFTAIADFSLRIYEREFFALLGPSGCGKTTVMRMLAGFETPTSGDILLENQNIVPVEPHQRPINMMFQSYALFSHLTVEDNIAFGLRRMRMPKPQLEETVSEMLNLVQLEPLRRRRPHQISGGQRQRVALARSLARRPKILLLDEPMAALDKKLRRETQLELMDIQYRLGTTFVIVTHDQEEAMTVASRIAVMDHGELVQVAPPLQLYENPVSRHVAEFVGETNLFEGNVEARANGKCHFIPRDLNAKFSALLSKPLKEGTACYLNIRPEKMEVTLHPPDDGSNGIAGKIIDIAYLGNISTYYVDVGSRKPMMVQMTNNQRSLNARFSHDDNVWVSWYPEDGLLLDR